MGVLEPPWERAAVVLTDVTTIVIAALLDPPRHATVLADEFPDAARRKTACIAQYFATGDGAHQGDGRSMRKASYRGIGVPAWKLRSQQQHAPQVLEDGLAIGPRVQAE